MPKLIGKVIVFKGKFESLTHDEMVAQAKALGAEVENVVTKDTYILVAGAGAGSPLKDAKKYRVKVIDEEAWIAMAGTKKDDEESDSNSPLLPIPVTIIRPKTNFSGMPLTAVVAEWLKSEEWDDEILIGDDRNTSQLATSMSLNDQPHKLFIEVTEAVHRLWVYMYGPVIVPVVRKDEMVSILNRINCPLPLGRLALPDDGNANLVQFKATIDVEGGALTPPQIGSMVGAATYTFEKYGHLMAAIALTKLPADTLWQNFQEEEAAKEAEGDEPDEGDGPSEL